MQGPDVVETSSELIYSGELSKISAHGWLHERVFFLFDHLMVYLKKVCRTDCDWLMHRPIGHYRRSRRTKSLTALHFDVICTMFVS